MGQVRRPRVENAFQRKHREIEEAKERISKLQNKYDELSQEFLAKGTIPPPIAVKRPRARLS